jgi:hypothetical protein
VFVPVQKVDNVRMAQVLEDANLLLDHVLMSLDSLFEDNLDSHVNTSVQRLGEFNSAICAGP